MIFHCPKLTMWPGLKTPVWVQSEWGGEGWGPNYGKAVAWEPETYTTVLVKHIPIGPGPGGASPRGATTLLEHQQHVAHRIWMNTHMPRFLTTEPYCPVCGSFECQCD